MRFAFIAAERACFSVRVLCRVLDVSRAGFYAWYERARAIATPAPRRRVRSR